MRSSLQKMATRFFWNRSFDTSPFKFNLSLFHPNILPDYFFSVFTDSSDDTNSKYKKSLKYIEKHHLQKRKLFCFNNFCSIDIPLNISLIRCPFLACSKTWNLTFLLAFRINHKSLRLCKTPSSKPTWRGLTPQRDFPCSTINHKPTGHLHFKDGTMGWFCIKKNW